MAIKQREILKLAQRVESLTDKMDELEYEKNVTKRMRNVILREFGKRVDDLKIEPFEVMLKKVEKNAVETLRKQLGAELNKNIELMIIELMKDFRKEFNRSQSEIDRDNKKLVGDFKKEITEMNHILEKKVALMEEDLFKRTTEIDDTMENLSKSIREAMNKLKVNDDSLKTELITHSDKLKRVEGSCSKSEKKLEKIEKDLGEIDLDKEIGYLNRKFGRDIEEIKKELRSLKAFDKTLLEKDIAIIWDEIDDLRKITKTESKKIKQELDDLKKFKTKRKKALPKVVTKIEKLEETIRKIKPQKVDKGLGRINDLEKLINEALKTGKRGKK